MSTYKKHILLSVTGMSPAVVTETLYALVTEKNIIPTEIRVITTSQGKNKLMKQLLGIEGGRKETTGAITDFIQDYGRKYGFNSIHFDESCIEVIKDNNGRELADIRTPEENNSAADQIVKLVGRLCQKEDTAIHASIAGGRKTMGFFLGYALSLYGRSQDSLSHVLISEEFENQHNFFYPKPYSHIIYNNQGRELDAQQGKVMLAEIPWVRLGLGIPDKLINKTVSYSNSIMQAQQILTQAELTFLSPIENREVLFGSQKIKLSPRGYSLLLSLVIFKLKDLSYTPHKREKEIKEVYLRVYDELTTNNEHLDRRLSSSTSFEDLKKVLSESRHDINKKLKDTFCLGKNVRSDYIPFSSRKTGNYELNIDLEHINIDSIKESILHLL